MLRSVSSQILLQNYRRRRGSSQARRNRAAPGAPGPRSIEVQPAPSVLLGEAH
jgi:hypothetical protein